jgi:lysophospholipid acyltransferase (LPLAT)-like uncharacterized protein
VARLSDRLGLKVKKTVLARIAVSLIRSISTTLRLKVEGWDQYANSDEKLIFCGWHGKSFIFANQFRKRGYWVIISNSNDGDIQDKVFRSLGFKTIRGSTGPDRGGIKAALQGVKALKEGGTMAITPDGPRGPSKVVQGGVMLMAKKSGARLVPVGISAQRAWYAGSWDSYMFPMPFSRARMIFGEPIEIPEKATEEEVESVRLALEQETERLDQLAANWA